MWETQRLAQSGYVDPALKRATEDSERQRIQHGHRRYVDWAARAAESWERQRPASRMPVTTSSVVSVGPTANRNTR